MFLKRSVYLMIYYVVVATFTCLAFSAFLTSYSDTQTLQDGLSKNSLQFSIQTKQNPTEFTNKKLIAQLKKESDSFLLYKGNEASRTKYVYLEKFQFPIRLNDEKMWKEIPEKSVILDESLLNNTTLRNGEPYFLYRGVYYKAIDSFPRENKYIYRNSSLFLSFPLEESAVGDYFIEGLSQESLTAVLERISAEYDNQIAYSIKPTLSGFKDRLTLALRDQAFVALVFLIAMFLITVSTLGTTLSWIQSKRDEIQARYLIGASLPQIRFWLIKEYLSVLAISFLIGNIFAKIIVSKGSFYEIIRETTLLGSLLSLLLCLFIGIATVLLSTFIRRKKATGSNRGLL